MVRVILKIDGMMCGMCEAHVNDRIRDLFKVKKVQSSHAAGETVLLADTAPNAEKLRNALAELGYTVTDMRTETVEKKANWLHRLLGKQSAPHGK